MVGLLDRDGPGDGTVEMGEGRYVKSKVLLKVFKFVGVVALWTFTSFRLVVELTYVEVRSEVLRDNFGLLDDIDVMDDQFGSVSKGMMAGPMIGSSRDKR